MHMPLHDSLTNTYWLTSILHESIISEVRSESIDASHVATPLQHQSYRATAILNRWISIGAGWSASWSVPTGRPPPMSGADHVTPALPTITARIHGRRHRRAMCWIILPWSLSIPRPYLLSYCTFWVGPGLVTNEKEGTCRVIVGQVWEKFFFALLFSSSDSPEGRRPTLVIIKVRAFSAPVESLSPPQAALFRALISARWLDLLPDLLTVAQFFGHFFCDPTNFLGRRRDLAPARFSFPHFLCFFHLKALYLLLIHGFVAGVSDLSSIWSWSSVSPRILDRLLI